jgi:hypothetical protein
MLCAASENPGQSAPATPAMVEAHHAARGSITMPLVGSMKAS